MLCHFLPVEFYRCIVTTNLLCLPMSRNRIRTSTCIYLNMFPLSIPLLNIRVQAGGVRRIYFHHFTLAAPWFWGGLHVERCFWMSRFLVLFWGGYSPQSPTKSGQEKWANTTTLWESWCRSFPELFVALGFKHSYVQLDPWRRFLDSVTLFFLGEISWT